MVFSFAREQARPGCERYQPRVPTGEQVRPENAALVLAVPSLPGALIN